MEQITIKKEPVDHDEISVEQVPTPFIDVTEVSTSKRNKSPKKGKSKSSKKAKSKKSSKRIKTEEASTSDTRKEKGKHTHSKIKVEKDLYTEPPRSEVIPDRTMSDFYCKVCDAHMNSMQVWESHIKGKRHLKNAMKDLDSSSSTVVKQESEEKFEHVEGLFFIDTVGEPSPEPSPPPSPAPSASQSAHKRSLSPTKETFERFDYSPEPTCSYSEDFISQPSFSRSYNFTDNVMSAVMKLPFGERMKYFQDMSNSIEIETQDEVDEIRGIIGALTDSVIHYHISKLPNAAQVQLVLYFVETCRVGGTFKTCKFTAVLLQPVCCHFGLMWSFRKHNEISKERN